MAARLLSLLFVVTTAGCSCGGGSTGTPCTTSADCTAGSVCIDGRCERARDGAGTDGGADGARPDGDPGDGGFPGACTVDPVGSAFEAPERALHWRGTGLPFPALEQAIVSPVVIDWLVDDPDDPIPEIVFVSYQTFGQPGVLRVVSGRAPYDTRMTLAGDSTGPVTDDTRATPSLRFDSHPAGGDLDGDMRPEVVAILHAGGAVAWRSDGSEYWRATFPAAEYGDNASVAIADLEHDGTPEVVIGRLVLDGQTGAVRWTGAGGRGMNSQGPLSCVADLDGEGSLEVIAGRTVYDARGGIVWEAAGGTGDGFCAIADVAVDAAGTAGRDGQPEVVRVAGGVLYVHARDGSLLWMRNLVSCNGERGAGGAPTIADFDGDGLMEIGVAGAFCYAVYDPGCVDPLPAGCAGQRLLWQRMTEDDSSNVTSSTVFDFNGDGRAEVIYNDEQYFFVLSGADGSIVFQDENPSRTRTEQPVVADVDNDGNAEIVFVANQEAAFAGDRISMMERIPGIEIWESADDSWVGARAIWNEHTYHIDNVQPNGVIPRDEAPSWMTHNTYRLNVSFESPLAAPDLVADGSYDRARCSEDVLVLCAEVRNDGDVRVGPGIEVAFYDGDPDAGGMPIGSGTTTRALEPGESERVCIDWRPAPMMARTVYVRVDAADAARECIETNNIAVIPDAFCEPFG